MPTSPRHFACVLGFLALSSCADSPTVLRDTTQLSMEFLAPSTVREVIVEVSGPGISPSLIVNAVVGADSIGRASVVVPAGADRRITALAVDTAGIETHRGDTTLTVRGGGNASVRLLLQPILSTVSVTVSAAGVRLTVVDTSTRVLDPTSATIDAFAIDDRGRPVPRDSLRWASSQPTFVEVRAGRVIGLRVGTAEVAVSYRGASVRVPVDVRSVPIPAVWESQVALLYQSFHNTVQANEGLNTQSMVMALEIYSYVQNFGLAPRAALPRLPINNQAGNPSATGNFANWSALSAMMRNAAGGVRAIQAYIERGATLGNAARDARALGFAWFSHGIALGTLAMGYDSVAMVTPAELPTALPSFVGPADAMVHALASLDSAAAIFMQPGVLAIPGQWVAASAEMTPADFVRLVRSYKARIRAGVARTPAEREAVDWMAVLADANAGLTDDHRIVVGSNGWWAGLLGQLQLPGGWAEVSLLYSGMADVSGAYQAFMAQPLESRIGFNIVVRTPDTRWPRGDTRDQQRLNSALPLPATQYLANRNPGDDVCCSWGGSQYDHRRWWEIRNSNGTGTYTFMSAREIQLLAAEGLIRTNNAAAAMPLINASRTANGLPAFTHPSEAAPGGGGCVPKLPNGECGSLLEALKYEKRMETQFTGYMQWFVDSRGWGDLIQGTALHWPVPFQEMELRGRAPYDMPSPGTLPAAPLGTYGFQ